jgi:hypothetical protein
MPDKNTAAATRSIGFIIGLEGHIPQAEAVEREFDLPIVAIVMSQQAVSLLQRVPSSAWHKVYSFPDYFARKRAAVDRMPLADLRTRIAQFEADWNIGSIATVVRMDRYLSRANSYEEMLRLCLLYLMFSDEILGNEDFMWVKGNITTFFGICFQHACVKRLIPSLKQQTARINGRVEFDDETKAGMLRGWKALYASLEENAQAVPEAVVAQADGWLAAFRDNPKRPAYAIKNSRTERTIQRMINRVVASVKVRFDKAYWKSVTAYPLDRALGLIPKFGQAFLEDGLLPDIRGLWQQRAGYFARPSLTEPYVYLPLQFQPEISTLTYAIRFEDQAHLARELSKALPAGWRLYVKDHTSMVGRRSRAFYRELTELYNVTLVDARVNTFDLIKGAKAVATITSTAGWEAFIFGKPVVVFGDVFFEQCPGVAKFDLSDDFATRLSNYVEHYRADESVIRRAVIAYFGATYEGKTGDIGEDTERSEAQRNAAAFARACRFQLENVPMAALSRPPATVTMTA